jgi:hypothetical protein
MGSSPDVDMKSLSTCCATVALVALSGLAPYGCKSSAKGAGVGDAALTRSELEIPRLTLTRQEVEAITKIDLTRPDHDAAGTLQTITLEKRDEGWEITAPIRAVASVSKVRELLENLSVVSIRLVVDEGDRYYGDLDLTEPKALHVVAWKGKDKLRELYFGKTDVRGQMTRVPGVRGVFAVTNWGSGGYSGFLFTRTLRSWRETSILKFQESDVVGVEISNKHGLFTFLRDGDRWLGTRARRDSHGKLAAADPAWSAFDAAKVDELLHNYRSLSADDFGEDYDRSVSGVDDAEQSGGIIRIKLKDRPDPLTIRVGKVSTRQTPWAIKGNRWAVEEGGIEPLYVLSPYTADWAVADASRFERTRERAGASDAARPRPPNSAKGD